MLRIFEALRAAYWTAQLRRATRRYNYLSCVCEGHASKTIETEEKLSNLGNSEVCAGDLSRAYEDQQQVEFLKRVYYNKIVTAADRLNIEISGALQSDKFL